MPVSISIDLVNGCVWARAEGGLSEADLLEALRQLVSDPDFRPGMPQLFDLGGVDEVLLGSSELRHVAAGAEALAEKLGVGKLAIVGERPLLYGLSRMYEVFTEGLGVEVRAFQSREEARAWLGLPDGAGPPR